MLVRVAVAFGVLAVVGCGVKPGGPVDAGAGGGLTASGGGVSGSGGGSAAGGSAGGSATAGGTAAAGGSASAGGAADAGPSTNCVVGVFSTCGSDCEVRLILPGVPSTQRYCTMTCDEPTVCTPYGAQLGCSLITGGACTPRCTSHGQCRDAGFGYCDLDGGTCDSYASCTTNAECTALGFRGCDTQVELCY